MSLFSPATLTIAPALVAAIVAVPARLVECYSTVRTLALGDSITGSPVGLPNPSAHPGY